MMKKANFLAAQDKECVPEQEAVTVFTPTEIAKFKREAFATFANGKRKYQQAAAYILMLNTGLRTGELLGLLNNDIDLERRVLHLERGVKEVWRRDGLQAEPGRDVKVGKLKSATSKRSVPLNDTAIAMINQMRKPGVRTNVNHIAMQHMKKENRQKPSVFAGFVAGAEDLSRLPPSVGPGRSPPGCRPPRHALRRAQPCLVAKSYRTLTKKSGTAEAIPDFFGRGRRTRTLGTRFWSGCGKTQRVVGEGRCHPILPASPRGGGAGLVL